MLAASSSSLVRSSTRSPTLNTMSTLPASSFAYRSACAAASSSSIQLHRAHPLRVVRRRLAGGEVVVRRQEWETGVRAPWSMKKASGR